MCTNNQHFAGPGAGLFTPGGGGLPRVLLCLLLLAISGRAQTMPIQHVVIIIKENRSFDHMFGTFPGANGATTGMAGSKQIPLGHAELVQGELGHGWSDSMQGIDHGKMDGFYKYAPHYAAYVQFQQTDIPNYWLYARILLSRTISSPRCTGGAFPTTCISRRQTQTT